jgi:hypothetical protein
MKKKKVVLLILAISLVVVSGIVGIGYYKKSDISSKSWMGASTDATGTKFVWYTDSHALLKNAVDISMSTTNNNDAAVNGLIYDSVAKVYAISQKSINDGVLVSNKFEILDFNSLKSTILKSDSVNVANYKADSIHNAIVAPNGKTALVVVSYKSVDSAQNIIYKVVQLNYKNAQASWLFANSWTIGNTSTKGVHSNIKIGKLKMSPNGNFAFISTTTHINGNNGQNVYDNNIKVFKYGLMGNWSQQSDVTVPTKFTRNVINSSFKDMFLYDIAVPNDSIMYLYCVANSDVPSKTGSNIPAHVFEIKKSFTGSWQQDVVYNINFSAPDIKSNSIEQLETIDNGNILLVLTAQGKKIWQFKKMLIDKNKKEYNFMYFKDYDIKMNHNKAIKKFIVKTVTNGATTNNIITVMTTVDMTKDPMRTDPVITYIDKNDGIFNRNATYSLSGSYYWFDRYNRQNTATFDIMNGLTYSPYVNTKNPLQQPIYAVACDIKKTFDENAVIAENEQYYCGLILN